MQQHNNETLPGQGGYVARVLLWTEEDLWVWVCTTTTRHCLNWEGVVRALLLTEEDFQICVVTWQQDVV